MEVNIIIRRKKKKVRGSCVVNNWNWGHNISNINVTTTIENNNAEKFLNGEIDL